MSEFGKLFDRFASQGERALLPARLSIVDCFWIFEAFAFESGGERKSVSLTRLSNSGQESETTILNDAFDLYSFDRAAAGFEVLLLDPITGSRCYWDPNEQFVMAIGNAQFISLCKPYPRDVEKHYFVESLLHMVDDPSFENPETLYERLIKT